MPMLITHLPTYLFPLTYLPSYYQPIDTYLLSYPFKHLFEDRELRANLSTYLHANLRTNLPTIIAFEHLPIYLLTNPPTYVPGNLPTYLPTVTYLPTYLPTYITTTYLLTYLR